MKKFLLVPSACLMLFACSPNQTVSYVQIDQTQDQTNPADWEITLKVKEALLVDGELATSNRFVSVSTTNGVVTISGNVSSKDQMKKIVKQAEKVPGVSSVTNKMKVTKSDE